MIRKLLLLLCGTALAILGVIGLVLPVLPRVLLLAAAVACFCLASRRIHGHVHRHLQDNPRYRRALLRWRAGRALGPWQRLRLGFWLTLASVMPADRR